MTDEYYDIDFQQKHPTVKGYWVQADKFAELYRKATALDKIRAEIEQLYTVDIYEDVIAVDKADVMQIIDKYK